MNTLRNVNNLLRTWLISSQEKRMFLHNVAIVKKLSRSSAAKRKVIIDCGFNQGIVAGRLLSNLPDFSLIGFEVQQDIQECSRNLQLRFPARHVEVIYSAVGSCDGVIEYFEASRWGQNYKGGTTTVAGKRSMSVNYAEPKTAPSIDFVRWLSNHFADGSFVFVKMDIEGAEYDVIDRLLETGAIDLIDVLAVEWHAEKFSEPSRAKYLEIEKKMKEHARSHRITVLDWY